MYESIRSLRILSGYVCEKEERIEKENPKLSYRSRLRLSPSTNFIFGYFCCLFFLPKSCPIWMGAQQVIRTCGNTNELVSVLPFSPSIHFHLRICTNRSQSRSHQLDSCVDTIQYVCVCVCIYILMCLEFFFFEN